MSGMELNPLCPGSYLLRVPEIEVSWIFNPWPDISKYLIQKGWGFNGVVCPDQRMQNEVACNLIEFPLLHALFVQGLIFQNRQPYLIGTPWQLDMHTEGFRRSLFAFYNEKELQGLGLKAHERKSLMKEIVGLSFKGIQSSEEIVAPIALKPLEEKPNLETATDFKGLKIWKESQDCFGLEFQGQKIFADCNLKEEEHYLPPLKVDVKNIPFTHFQVIDTGEEDGFSSKSCMHTVLQWRDKVICIDLPMNVSYLLERISISNFEIDAVIFTHCHDDHIGDLPMLMNLGHKVKVICPPVIWRSILLKASNTLYMSLEEIEHYFDYIPIHYGEELNFGGLRILAHPSIHSVPCSIYRIKGMVRGEWKSYVHLSDILNLKRARKLVEDGFITEDRYVAYKDFLLQEADIKKVDVGTVTGKEMFSVHGHWKDFLEDKSKHIVLGHISANLLDEEAKVRVGQLAAVGSARDLSEGMENAYVDKYIERAIKYLSEYLMVLLDELGDEEPEHEDIMDSVRLLANQEIKLIQPHTPFVRIGEDSTFVDMIVSGIGSIWKKKKNGVRKIATIHAGDVIGDMGVLMNAPRNASVKAETYMRVLRIPGRLFSEEMERLKLFVAHKKKGHNQCIFAKIWKHRRQIQISPVVGIGVPIYLQNRLAQQMDEIEVEEGERVYSSSKRGDLYLAHHPNALELGGRLKGLSQEFLKVPIFGEGGFCDQEEEKFTIIAKKKTKILKLPGIKRNWVMEVPLFRLRLLELLESRNLLIKRWEKA